jgi:hypothetical protein
MCTQSATLARSSSSHVGVLRDCSVENARVLEVPYQLSKHPSLLLRAAKTTLPPRHYHGHPFDRMLIAHALEENARIVTKDAGIACYPVQTIR